MNDNLWITSYHVPFPSYCGLLVNFSLSTRSGASQTHSFGVNPCIHDCKKWPQKTTQTSFCGTVEDNRILLLILVSLVWSLMQSTFLYLQGRPFPNSHDATLPTPLPLSSPPFLVLPSFPFPFPYSPFSSSSFALPSLIYPLNPARGPGEGCKLPQRGLGWSPSRNRIWCILALKYDIWWQQFQWFSWESIYQISCSLNFKQYQGKSGPRHTTR